MDKNVLISAIKDMDYETMIQGLKEQWTYNTFYLKQDALVVSVDVVHAIGHPARFNSEDTYKGGLNKAMN